MSNSPESRLVNIYNALDLLTKEVGDEWIENVIINPGVSAGYEAIMNTTWDELQERRYIESRDNGYYFTLTGLGWRLGMERLGKKTDQTFQEQIGELAAVLKGPIKGRANPEFLYVQDVAQEAGMPEGLVCNIVDAKLFENWKNRVGPEWESYKGKGRLIKVPIRFDLQRLR